MTLRARIIKVKLSLVWYGTRSYTECLGKNIMEIRNKILASRLKFHEVLGKSNLICFKRTLLTL